MAICIKNGLVIDPANKVMGKLNLIVEDGKITKVTTEDQEAEMVIDAAGKVVVPGFIDIHFHEDPYDEKTGQLRADIAETALRMGVTSAFGGNCGINVLEPTEYFRLLDRDGALINVGLFCGHNYFREKAGAMDKYRPVSAAELQLMKEEIRRNLEAGCFGISFGVKYTPGMDEQELLEIAGLCQNNHKSITAHIRDDAEYVLAAAQEMLEVAKAQGLSLQLSHIGSMGGFGQMSRLLQLIDAYRANGVAVTSDCYPYYAFSTRIGETTYDDGFLERYQMDYQQIEICDGKYSGQRCSREIFEELRREHPETITVCHVMKVDEVDLALLHPGVMLASDGLLNGRQGHPRAAGTFPRFIKNYVKTGKMNLYSAIEKMTAMPAEKLSLSSKGRLSAGADGDIVIFDLNQIADQATFSEPTAPPAGIEYVFVNGELALSQGEIVNRRLGKALRKL